MYYADEKKKFADASKRYRRAQRSFVFGAHFHGEQKKVATNTGRFSADLVPTSQIEARSGPEQEGNEERRNDEELLVRDWLVSKGAANGVLIAAAE